MARIHEELYKKDLHDPDNHNSVITHLEPDNLECEVKWALESITTNKASGGDGIPVKLFQILKDDAVKVLHSVCQQIWKTQRWPQNWKRSVFIISPKKGNAKKKKKSKFWTMSFISLASKVIFKILASVQQYMKRELSDVQDGFRKGRGTRDQIANICWVIEKAREFRKIKSTCALLTLPKPLAVWITAKCVKFLKRWKYQVALPASWEIYMQLKKKQNKTNKQKKTVRSGHRTTFWFQIGTGVRQRCVLSPCLFNLYRVHHVKCQVDKAQAGINIAGVNINNLRYADGTTLR